MKASMKEITMTTPQPDLTEAEIEQLRNLATRLRGVRKQSEHLFLGLPLYAIAVGPDPARGEFRGHARGVFALGDVATGIVALGGLARGVIAIGGLAVGIVAIGGLSVGLLVAFGGMALGLIAVGGGALGGIAVGGVSLGYYASGGLAYGTYVLDALQRSPEALNFFSHWGFLDWFGARPPNRR
jgi:hypothetical protein